MEKIKSAEQYIEQMNFSRQNPDAFWNQLAENDFDWIQKWSEVSNCSMELGKFTWFKDAKLNITLNCIDRHLKENADQIAYIFEPNEPTEAVREITYQELHDEVCKMANVLRSFQVQKGDRVCIYLPMIPELVFAVLTCARIGAIHSVVFAGFSSGALETRIEDCGAKLIITADGAYRGDKQIDLKSIVDKALEKSKTVETVLVVQRIKILSELKEGRDFLLAPLLSESPTFCEPETMDAEDPLFILYTSGSTGKPKGMVHSCAGYMVYVSYSFKNVFQYEDKDVYWCTADIGWITGHSYIIYGPLLNRATSVLFEGVPSFPDCSRFWQTIEKHKVTQFYTAPTAIRALAKETLDLVKPYPMESLKLLGTVGEPINEEAWQWYFEHVGKKNCPIVDTWWQTETGGILISPLPNAMPIQPTFATLPLPGIEPVLLDEEKRVIHEVPSKGSLCIQAPWPSIARTIWGDHQRFIDTYFKPFPGFYFTGDGALRDEKGFFRIIGRMDDVIIVSGHNLGTAPIEDAINSHSLVAESAVVGFPHEVKGNALFGFIILKTENYSGSLEMEINQLISNQIGPIAKLEKMIFVSGLPKTRSGKIMRRILRKIAEGEREEFGDISTLLNPECVAEIVQKL